MMTRRAVSWLVAGGALGVLAVFVWAGFKRQYVIPASGLLDVTATAMPRQVLVSGVLLSSMAHVTRTTTEPYKEGVIVRVYVDLIRPGDDLDKLTRSFSTAVPRSQETRVIYIGDGQEWETIGQLYGVPVRVPHRKEWAAKVVWRETTR